MSGGARSVTQPKSFPFLVFGAGGSLSVLLLTCTTPIWCLGTATAELGLSSGGSQARWCLLGHRQQCGEFPPACPAGLQTLVSVPAFCCSAAPIHGFLEDYVFIIQGLFDLYEASLDQSWLEWALQLQHTQDKLFWDPKGFAYFSSEAGDPSLLLRLKDGAWGPWAGQGWCWHWAGCDTLSPADQDGAEPTANSVTVTNLLRAASYSGHMEWVEKAGQILAAFSERLQKIPLALPEMARATALFHHTLKQV